MGLETRVTLVVGLLFCALVLSLANLHIIEQKSFRPLVLVKLPAPRLAPLCFPAPTEPKPERACAH